jgi:hypothetical protein
VNVSQESPEKPTEVDRDVQVDDEWIAEQLAKAPRHLNQEQARLARQLRARTGRRKQDGAA